jgi:hypothetical protein
LPLQIPHNFTWAGTTAAAVRSRRLTGMVYGAVRPNR